MDKLFQNRKHEKAVRKNGRTDSVSTAHVHMETLENAKEQGKESYQTWSAAKCGTWHLSYAKGYARVCRSWNLHICISKERLAKFGLVSMEDYYAEKAVTC